MDLDAFMTGLAAGALIQTPVANATPEKKQPIVNKKASAPKPAQSARPVVETSPPRTIVKTPKAKPPVNPQDRTRNQQGRTILKPGEATRVTGPTIVQPKPKAGSAAKPVQSASWTPDPEYTPQWLGPQQIQRESNKRQFDDRGGTLLGRYQDGSTPPDAQKSWGIAQIQVGTAQTTAKKHGIPFNRDKLMKDKNYNLRLGDLYMKDLTEQFGDPVKAQLAYHQGPDRVTKALKDPDVVSGKIQYWDSKHIGPLGRKYIGKSDLPTASNQPAAGEKGVRVTDTVNPMDFSPIEITDVSQVKATESEKAATKVPATYPIVDPFKLNDRASQAAARVVAINSDMDGVLERLKGSLDTLQAGDRQALETRNQATSAARGAIMESNVSVAAEAMPYMQKRAAIRDRKAEIAEMGAFERLIKGTFDPAYNLDALEQTDAIYADLLGDMDSDHGFVTKTYGQQAAAADENFKEGQADRNLTRTHFSETIALNQLLINQADTAFQQISTELGVQGSIQAAQSFKMNQVLGDLTLGQVNQLLVDANGAPTVMVNGIEIPVARIEERQATFQDRETAKAVAAAGIRDTNNTLYQKGVDEMLSTMSLEDVRAAVANRGMFNGMQLPMTQLIAYEKILVDGAGQTAAGIGEAGATDQLISVVEGTHSRIQFMNPRVVALGGGASPRVAGIYKNFNVLAGEYQAGVEQAKAAGPAVIAAYNRDFSARFAQLNKDLDAAEDEIAKNWGGGSAGKTAVAKSFLSGGTLQPAVAGPAFNEFVIQGFPSGTNLSPAASKAVSAGRAAGKAYDEKQGAQAVPFGQKPVDPAKDPARIEVVNKAAASAYSEEVVNQTWIATPSIAKALKHPFGDVVPQGEWMGHLAAAEDAGLVATGEKLGGLTRAQTKSVLSSEARYNSWAKESGTQYSYKTAQSIYNAGEQGALFGILDSTYAPVGGKPPSHLLASMMLSPDYQKAAGNFMDNQAREDIGNYVVSGLAGSRPRDMFRVYGNSFMPSYNSYESARKNKAARDQQDAATDNATRGSHTRMYPDGK